MKTLVKCPQCGIDLPFRDEATRPGGQTCGSCGHSFRISKPLPAAVPSKERLKELYPELAAALKPGQPFYHEPYCHRVDRSDYLLLICFYFLAGIGVMMCWGVMTSRDSSQSGIAIATLVFLILSIASQVIEFYAVRRFLRGARKVYRFTREYIDITAGVWRSYTTRIPMDSIREVQAGWTSGDDVGNLIVETSDPIHPTHVLRGCIRPLTLLKLIESARKMAT